MTLAYSSARIPIVFHYVTDVTAILIVLIKRTSNSVVNTRFLHGHIILLKKCNVSSYFVLILFPFSKRWYFYFCTVVITTLTIVSNLQSVFVSCFCFCLFVCFLTLVSCLLNYCIPYCTLVMFFPATRGTGEANGLLCICLVFVLGCHSLVCVCLAHHHCLLPKNSSFSSEVSLGSSYDEAMTFSSHVLPQ